MRGVALRSEVTAVHRVGDARVFFFTSAQDTWPEGALAYPVFEA